MDSTMIAERPVAVEFGARLRAIRMQKGLSIGQVARKAEVSPSYLSDLERGKRGAPTAPVLARLADALDVSADALLGRHVAEDPRAGEVIALNRGKLPPNLPPEAKEEYEHLMEYLEWKYGNGPKPKER